MHAPSLDTDAYLGIDRYKTQKQTQSLLLMTFLGHWFVNLSLLPTARSPFPPFSIKYIPRLTLLAAPFLSHRRRFFSCPPLFSLPLLFNTKCLHKYLGKPKTIGVLTKGGRAQEHGLAHPPAAVLARLPVAGAQQAAGHTGGVRVVPGPAEQLRQTQRGDVM